MSFQVLEKAWISAYLEFEREHTTPYIWDNPEIFRIGNVELENGMNYSKTHRFTIDYPEDFLFIKEIYHALYSENPNFTLHDILILLNKRPELLSINSKYHGEYWTMKYSNELKTLTK